MKNSITVGLLVLLPCLAVAQRKKAPAPAPVATGAYWQQEVNYSIDVALDDQKHELTGREELTYTNNSPKALTFIWFHLWPNAYRDNSTAFARQQLRNGSRKFQFAKASQRGYIDGLEFKVNGQDAKLEYDPANADIAKLLLPKPLAAGASVTITTPFRVKIPDSFSRFGHVGQSYQVTQWYPKPAVLDRRGWHQMPYLDQGEFYSEFGAFDVTITLPANYVVGATGELQNPDERANMDALAASTALKKTEKDFGKDLTFPASATATKTLRYKQDRVHDFAWFADKRFNVLKSGVTLPSGRAVTSWVLFTNKEPERWIKGLEDVNKALTGYSQWVGEYPYSAATAVDGALSAGGGMEYPMVTVTMPSAITHEVGHNWFYGILGSNERDFPWLDEGVNTYTDSRVSGQDTAKIMNIGNLKNAPHFVTAGVEGLPPSAFTQVPYQAVASRGLDQPVQGPTSADYGKLNYGVIVYNKTAALLKYLAGYLGQAKFDAAMQAYYARWQFKHPYPEDMQAVFEESTGQKLGWFFKNMLTNTNEYNADISATLLIDDLVKVLVRTDSPVPWAVPVATLDAQGQVLETQWTTPFGSLPTDEEEEAETQLNFRRQNVAAIVVDPAYLTPQLHRRDDRLLIGDQHLPRFEPIRLRPLASIERWDQAAINWLPVLGVNTSDKFMLGAAFYNSPLVPKRLQYLAMPMYSFARNEVNGIGRLQLNVLPASPAARQIVTGVTFQRFERYFKIEPTIRFVLPHSAFKGIQQQGLLGYTAVEDQDFNTSTSIVTVEYGLKGGNALHTWGGHIELNQLAANQLGFTYARPATMLRASATYQRYYSPKKRVQARLFGGRFLQARETNDFAMGLSGSPDYRRQTAFLDRQQISNTFTAQVHQTDDRDGAFKAFVPVYSNRWLSTLNLQADVPMLPLSVFADFGAVDSRVTLHEAKNSQRLFYDAGLVVPLFKNVLQFYVPVAGSQFADGLPGSRQDFTDGIRFVLRLDQLNPFRLLDEQLAQ